MSDTPLLDPIPGILDLGEISLLNGASGVGKTCLTAGILAHLRTSTSLFGYPTHPPRHIAYMSVDRGWASARHWFEVAEFPDIAAYSFKGDRTISHTRLLTANRTGDLFAEILGKWQLPPGTLLVVDPFALFLGNVMNPHLCSALLIQISRLLEDAQIAVLGLMHSVKEKNDPKDRYARANNRMGGTGWMSGYSHAQLSLLAPEEGGSGQYEFHITPHTMPSSVHGLIRGDNGGFLLDQATMISGRVPNPTPTPVSVCEPELLAVLHALSQAPAHWLTTGDLIALYVADAGPVAARKRVERILGELLARGYVMSPRKGRWLLLKLPSP